MTCICATYHRPVCIANAIACFESQVYQNRELLILDDAGQYHNQKGDRWELISIPRRYRTLEEKWNAVIGLASNDTTYISMWDDDDTYLPWHLAEMVHSFEQHPDAAICKPKTVYHWEGDKLISRPANGMFHSSWLMRHRRLVETCCYHPTDGKASDQIMGGRLSQYGTCEADIVPSFVYSWFVTPYCNASALGDAYYDNDKKSIHTDFVGAVVPTFADYTLRAKAQLGLQ